MMVKVVSAHRIRASGSGRAGRESGGRGGGPVAAGLVTGKHGAGVETPKDWRQLAGWTEPPIREVEKLWDIVEVLVAIGAERGVSAAQIALAWLLGRPGVTSLVVGGRNEAQFRDNFGAVDLKLTEDELKRLNDVSRVPLIYPYWHQRNFATDRFSEADWALHKDYVGVE